MPRKYLTVVLFVLGIAGFLLYVKSYSATQNGKTTNAIPNFRKINNNLYAGGRPGEKGVKQLSQMGIKTIVNLERGFFKEEPEVVKKEERWAKELGIEFQRVPMHSVIIPNNKEVDKALDLITDSRNKPVFVHCEHGKDRTGIVVAAYRKKVDGWSPEQAYKEMKKYGFHWYLFWWKGYIFQYGSKQKEELHNKK